MYIKISFWFVSLDILDWKPLILITNISYANHMFQKLSTKKFHANQFYTDEVFEFSSRVLICFIIPDQNPDYIINVWIKFTFKRDIKSTLKRSFLDKNEVNLTTFFFRKTHHEFPGIYRTSNMHKKIKISRFEKCEFFIQNDFLLSY